MSDFSVIVPAYNSENFIERCLNSLVNQTLKDIEIIVINDGSTDSTQKIIDRFKVKHSNIRAYQTENQGIASTRNFGLSKVKTKYFGFLDSDDVAKKTMFEEMYECAIKNDADVVVCNFDWVYSNKRRTQKEGPYQIEKDMLVNLFATLWNKIYKTETITNSKIQFPSGNRYEDAYFLYCLTPLIKKVEFIDESFVDYYQHDSSITHTNNNEVKNMIRVFELIVEFYKENNLYSKYKEELEYLHIRFFLGNSFLRSSQIKDIDDRKKTILLGWNLLNTSFPSWKKNTYLDNVKSMKNRYFKLVTEKNIMIFAKIFNLIKG
ncbi:MAG: glycosyltransferase [Anaerorhabdus sp.]